MLNTVITICAMWGLAFLVKDSDGPWGIMNWMRRKLIQNKYCGVFFYKLLDCYFCTGWWAGLAIYFLTQESYKFKWAVCWGLTGGAVCLIMDAILTRLHRE